MEMSIMPTNIMLIMPEDQRMALNEDQEGQEPPVKLTQYQKRKEYLKAYAKAKYHDDLEYRLNKRQQVKARYQMKKWMEAIVL
jgi:hypothetical protein